MKYLFRLALLAPLLALAPAAAVLPASAATQRLAAGDDAVLGLRMEDGLRRSCRRKVRRAYGPVKGRHASSIRIAAVEQCVDAGGHVR